MYCSLQEDRKTFATNAKNILWRGQELLLHPPIGLINKGIQKLIRDEAESVLIHRRWYFYNYRSMIPKILSQVTLGQSEQVLTRGKFMKEQQKLPPIKIELIKIIQIIEIWGEMRAGLTSLAQYIKEKCIRVKDLIGNELADDAMSKHCCYGQLKEKKTQQCMNKSGVNYPRRTLQHHSTVATNLQTSQEELASSLYLQIQSSATP
ncbi:MAG: hypothetical protein EZS28_007159 [Streblomastix strix]|uniref:Uncharacterized protein n=1 Tax=Streblomastix strix TaxID=222440 RepID=A0A5J4WSC1_9EUKA|nr:MAG: hypothetical protein EZS28_007159 [Streblomastix strix]